MPFGFLNALLLIGLAGLAIPPIIHLLNRRRYEVVDWGAMQFLKISETTRRRLIIEELLLMLMRMGLIGVLVLAMAAPYLISPWLNKLLAGASGRPNRDVVIIFDGSYSMGYTGSEKTPHEQAKEWAQAYVNQLSAGDGVAILQAKQQVVRVIGEPTMDLEKVRESIRKLPEPRGGVHWPSAVNTALDILRSSRRGLREVVVISDGQRIGWCDENTLLRWELMAHNLTEDPAGKPNVWVVNIGQPFEKPPKNWTLEPLRASRAVTAIDQEVRFRTSLQLSGQETYTQPYKLRLEIDGGRERKDIPFPENAKLEKGQVPLEFTHRFATAGSHLISVIVEPDPPVDRRGPGYQAKDELPGDNRQDISIEVVEQLPVLIVDGDARPAPKHRGSDYLKHALAPTRNLTPPVLAKTVPCAIFSADDLRGDLDAKHKGSRARVLVLFDVPRLSAEQMTAVNTFLEEGGSILVTLGDRADAGFYNDHLFKGGEGWLPARLEDKAGNETEEAKAISPQLNSFYHPALNPFREAALWDLGNARFPKWWKVGTPGRNSPAAPVALLNNGDPLFVERSFGLGRVILCTVPMDKTWRANIWETYTFAPMAHELMFYLAGARSTDFNLSPGQPLRYRPDRDETPAAMTVQTPEGEARAIPDSVWPPIFEDTRETGVYTLKTPDARTYYYVVQPDLRESDLTKSEETERKQVIERVGGKVEVKYESEQAKVVGEDSIPPRMELWWLFMGLVTLLLLGEVWMTRRIALRR
jgi:hypothetical protein